MKKDRTDPTPAPGQELRQKTREKVPRKRLTVVGVATRKEEDWLHRAGPLEEEIIPEARPLD